MQHSAHKHSDDEPYAFLANRDSSLTRRIAEIARTAPDLVALRAGQETMTYGALNARANRLAFALASAGLARDTPVGICLPRGFDQVAAILAALKVGGAFLPLDSSWPIERLRHLLEDAGAPVVIAAAELAAQIASAPRIAICPDRDAGVIAGCEARDPDLDNHPEDLAYIIYTSGSTGEPKGVEITHGNLLNLVRWHGDAFAVTENDHASHLAGLGFDAAIWEVWPYLYAGAAVSLAPEEVRTAPELLRRWLIDERITIAFAPTSLAEPMLAAEWPHETALRLLLTGAETVHSYPRPGLPFQLINNYGPTECAVVTTSAVLPAQEARDLPPIGRPIANARVHLLDPLGRPVKPGEIGEIHIGGAGVGRGYRHRPELTARHFVADPFTGVEGGRLYRSGDLGCLLADGQIRFHGRLDSQEKIRGHRIEPDEIASALNRHPLVAASAVTVRCCGDGDKRLVAYVIAATEGPPTAEALRSFLAELLPDYMIPTGFVRVDSLPLTTSGKLDRAALPEPSEANSLDRADFREPATKLEAHLAAIFADVLGIARVGADDNFFLMGGHSLLGTQSVLRIRDAFGVDLTLWHLFEAQTVAKLASIVELLLFDKLAAMSEEEAARRLAV